MEQTDEKKIWEYLFGKIRNAFGVAGLMGNLYVESNLIPYRVQGDFQFGYQYSKAYTSWVDSGAVSKNDFLYHGPNGGGYGLAQWTYWNRKKELYEFAEARNASIGDLEMQLDFLYQELSKKFTTVLKKLQTATTVLQASNAVLFGFECPSDQGASVQNYRASIGQKYYSKYATASLKGDDNVGYLTYSKKHSTKVSAHFDSTEFDCHGNGCCSKTIVNERLIGFLEQIREHFNAPITITSAYRCITHNSNVGGATGSRHSKGDAVDIVVKGVAPRAVAQYAESIGILGIGLYETQSDGYFVHIDARDYKSFWYGQAQQARTTFGNMSTTNSNTGAGSTASTILNRGDRGANVKALQEKLIKLGYSCGAHGADGDFGNGTYSAVCKFQKEHGIGVDGIVGYQTMTAIDKAVAELDKSSDVITVRVTASLLNIRQGAGTNYAITGAIKDKGIYRIVAESSGSGASKWGKLEDGRGWIALDYCTKEV